MGSILSSSSKNKTPAAAAGSPMPIYNASQGMSPPSPGQVDVSQMNRRQQQQKLDEAYRTIQALQNQIYNIQRNSLNYDNGLPLMGRPPSPLLNSGVGRSSPFQQPFGSLYRDNDYTSLANIAGLNQSDVALLHREFLNLTRGGTNKMDRVVFRQLLRESLIEANNENIDRAIENIFISIDRNRDGFIDFSEFVGAFRDILRSQTNDPIVQFGQKALTDLNNERGRYGQQFNQGLPSFVSGPQNSVVYNGPSPLVLSVDSNSQGQSTFGNALPLQCYPIP